MRGLLQLAAFRRLLAAYALNQLAFLIGSFTLSVLVYRRTGSAPAAAGFFLCSEFVPSLLAPLLVGRLSRLRPRRVLPLLAFGDAAMFAVLAVLVHHFWLPGVLALALADGVISLLGRTLARTALATVLTPSGLLREGNAVINTVFSVAYTGGPAVSGVVIAAGGIRTVLLVVAAAFVAVGVVLARGAPDRSGDGGEEAHRRRSPRETLRRIRRERDVYRLLLLQAAAIVTFTIPTPVEIVFVHRSLHDGTQAYGVLLAVWGVGSIVGSAAYAAIRRLPGRTTICLGSAALGVGFAGLAAAPSLAVALVAAAVCGVGMGIVGVSMATTLQEWVSGPLLAMIIGLTQSTGQAAPGAGIVIGGALTTLAGPRAALAVAAGAVLLVTAAAGLLLPGSAPTVPPAA